MSAVTAAPVLRIEGQLADLAEQLVTWLETGVRPDAMFAADVFADLSVPHWRIQADGDDATFHLREDSHPFLGKVTVAALDATSRGFLVEFEERWLAEGQEWYCRELIHCCVEAGLITECRIYCTGDWDEAVQARHAARVSLVRP